jgi:hypothetical protein
LIDFPILLQPSQVTFAFKVLKTSLSSPSDIVTRGKEERKIAQKDSKKHAAMHEEGKDLTRTGAGAAL